MVVDTDRSGANTSSYIMANKELGDWNPMEEAHNSPVFNTYVEGPGARLSTHHQPFNRGNSSTGRNFGSATTRSGDKIPKLHITNVPINMTQDGLRNVMRPYAVAKSIYVKEVIRGSVSTTTWATVEFDTYGDAEAVMKGCNDKPPYHLMVKFFVNKERNDGIHNIGRRTSGPDAPSTPRVNRVHVQGVPPNSPANTVMPRAAVNSSPLQPSNSNHNNSFSNADQQVGISHCKVCRTETSGLCGACRNESYCSQSCATEDFQHHILNCYIPVPAVFFAEPGRCIVRPPLNSSAGSYGPSTPIRGLSNGRQFRSPSSSNTGNDIGAAGDGHHNSPHSGIMNENRKMNGENSNMSNVPLGNGDIKPIFNQVNSGNVTSMGPTRNDHQDMAENCEHQNNHLSKHANENMGSVTLKKKQRLPNEELVIGTPEKVEAVYGSKFNLFGIKTCNSNALETLNKGLQSTMASMLPFDNQQEFCAAPYQGKLYRGKVLVNKYPNPLLRVKFVDFGNILMIDPCEVKSLPETFFELPAQAIQMKIQGVEVEEGSSYSAYEGSILTVTALEKCDASWIVDVKTTEADSPPSVTPAQTASPQCKSDAVASSSSVTPAQTASPRSKSDTVAKNMTPLPRQVVTASPEVAPTTTVPAAEQINVAAGHAAETSRESVLPPLGIFTMVTVTQVTSDRMFWGTLTSSKEDIEAMEEKLNKLLEANPSPCQPEKDKIVAVLHEDCWHRAKVLKLLLEKRVKLGLIDYGHMIETSIENIHLLPDELQTSTIPQQAVKFIMNDGSSVVLLEDIEISVRRTSAEQIRSCYPVDVKSRTEPCVKQENREPTVKVVDVPTAVRLVPHAGRITSLEVEQLPIGDYVEVSIVVVAGKSFWVNMTKNMMLAHEILTKLDSHCKSNPTPCQPQVGDIVAAPFDNEWYRAKVLTVLPKLRVVYVDYGNESEVPINQVKVLPMELTCIPAQAIKITFSDSTSLKYHNLAVDSQVRVKPVGGGMKSADNSVIVQVEGDGGVEPATLAPVQATLEPVVSKGPWFPLQSVEMPTETFVELTITLSGKTGTGYAYLTKNMDALNLMMCKLHTMLDKSHAPCQPQVGAIVGVRFDGIWHRGKVLEVVPQLKLALVDYGNIVTINPVNPGEICCLPDTFLDLPGQAIKITFIDGTPEEYFDAEEESSFKGKVQKKLPDGAVLIEARDLKPGLVEQASAEKSPAAIVPVASSSAPPVPILQELGCSQRVSMPSETEIQVVVSHAEGDLPWVNIVENIPELEQLMDSLQLVMKGNLKPCAPKVGDFVAVLFAALEMWHRGQVLSKSNGKLSVRLIDYGSVDVVTPDLVQVLPDEFTILPAQSIPLQFMAGSAEKSNRLNLDDNIYVIKKGIMNMQNVDNVCIVMCLNK